MTTEIYTGTNEKDGVLLPSSETVSKINKSKKYNLFEVMNMNRHQRRAMAKANGIKRIPGIQDKTPKQIVEEKLRVVVESEKKL